jgi:hypothetical protein
VKEPDLGWRVLEQCRAAPGTYTPKDDGLSSPPRLGAKKNAPEAIDVVEGRGPVSTWCRGRP